MLGDLLSSRGEPQNRKPVFCIFVLRNLLDLSQEDTCFSLLQTKMRRNLPIAKYITYNSNDRTGFRLLIASLVLTKTLSKHHDHNKKH